MAVTDIIWPLLVRGLIKPLVSLVFSGMRGSELLCQYVIVFTSCFVSECYDFQLFFSFLMLGPALWHEITPEQSNDCDNPMNVQK